MLIDVHCHLTAPEFRGNVKNIVKEALESGVKIIVTSGLGYEDCLRALEISDHEVIYPSLGVRPYALKGYERVMELIRRERARIVAIGEVGLDYWRGERETWELQHKVFTEFIKLAKELDLPIIIHSRSAGKYAIDLLLEHGAERVIMHAFDGAASHAVRGAERGFMFSIPPSVARSPQKQKLVKRVPLENLLLESDAPVLAPKPGELNYPKNVKVSAEWISRIKGATFDKVVEVTGRNAVEVLGLKV